MSQNRSGEEPSRVGSRWLILIPFVAVAVAALAACTSRPTGAWYSSGGSYSSSESSGWESSEMFSHTNDNEAGDSEYHEQAESHDNEYHEDLEKHD